MCVCCTRCDWSCIISTLTHLLHVKQLYFLSFSEYNALLLFGLQISMVMGRTVAVTMAVTMGVMMGMMMAVMMVMMKMVMVMAGEMMVKMVMRPMQAPTVIVVPMMKVEVRSLTSDNDPMQTVMLMVL